MDVITSARSEKLETEVKYLHDEIMTLKMAIEEAIIKGQKSLDLVSDIPESDTVVDEDFAMSCADAVPGVVGWIDDF
jgi:hypothetical protein